MSGGGVTSRGAGVNDIVIAGRPRPRAGRNGEGDGDGNGGKWGRGDDDVQGADGGEEGIGRV